MRIAFLVDAFPTLSETFILNQITGLLDLGQDVEIFAAQRGPLDVVQDEVSCYNLLDRTHYHNDVPEDGIQRIWTFLARFPRDLIQHPAMALQPLNLFRFGRDALSLRPYFRASLFLRRGPFDILQCHFGRNGLIGASLKEMGIPGRLVTMFHGYDIRLALREGGQIYRRLFEQGDCFLAISQGNRDHLIRFGADAGKIRYHPVGIDLDCFIPAPGQSAHLEHPKIIQILTVARLVKEKAVDDGIRAVARLKNKKPNLALEYRIIGDGPEKTRLHQLAAELKINAIVKFLGAQAREKVISALKKAHIFLLPSREEVLPVVLMEALASGLPVIATSVGSIDEIVKNGRSGHLVQPGDIEAMSNSLTTLIDHPEEGKRMASYGRMGVAKNFDIKILNSRLIRIYESLL